jgi:hypothetical protein
MGGGQFFLFVEKKAWWGSETQGRVRVRVRVEEEGGSSYGGEQK